MRVVGGGKIGKMPPDAVIRQLRDMVGTEMRGKELEGADTDMAARDAGENRARTRALALHVISGRNRGERARRRTTKCRHRLGHQEFAEHGADRRLALASARKNGRPGTLDMAIGRESR